VAQQTWGGCEGGSHGAAMMVTGKQQRGSTVMSGGEGVDPGVPGDGEAPSRPGLGTGAQQAPPVLEMAMVTLAVPLAVCSFRMTVPPHWDPVVCQQSQSWRTETVVSQPQARAPTHTASNGPHWSAKARVM
jgi:hypothetical protein